MGAGGLTRYRIDDLVDHGGVSEQGSDEGERLGVGKGGLDEGLEEQEHAEELEDKADEHAESVASHDHRQPKEVDGATLGLRLPEEELEGLLRANEGNNAHQEADVSDEEEASIEEEHDAEGKARQSN
eukprot:CAMPEP_0168623304 /NCGR_PEP_ID=MMETSP0449_2-20121227/8749_1 /TAXON_ID=1082188 /ORGANISM="Strombidium rassoulzadegani, Strain ras09" /LENGTH=127 /DNA_ID=CAMNT_0008664667 /DNA_START=236 /DNA_END=619 /DNA_ORIENTATION=-